MNTRPKFIPILFALLIFTISACGLKTKPEFIAPEIDPPADLVSSYIPEGFELVSGFQLSGVEDMPGFPRIKSFNVKSPSENDIQGVYYRNQDHLILISKSYFPEGTLDLWLAAYEAAQTKPCECECLKFHMNRDTELSLFRILPELQEERTVNGNRVVVLQNASPWGWTTVFVRGDYLLTVESGISLEENLKVVASLLEK
jgi:hypothetical protein